MAEPEDRFIQQAGTVYFPRGTTDLTSTRHCPACFTRLNTLVCAVCGLDLNHPAAAELATVSKDAAALLTRRISIIGRMRLEKANLIGERKRNAKAARLAAAPALVNPSAPTPTAPTTPASAPATVIAPPAAGTVPAPAAQPPAPRRSSVQVILLIVGISLLSLAAIFFLVYAFINFGLIWRTVIIGAITIAAFTVASLLKRRNLGATAEGIAVFAVVLVCLDAFALRENNLLGLQAADGLIYWGIVLLLSAVGFLFWHRASGLRTASIAAFASLAPGAGIFVAGLAENADGAVRAFASFAAAAAVGVAHPLASRKPGGPRGVPEKTILLSLSGLAFLSAIPAAVLVEPDFDWAATIASFVLAAVAAAHVAVFASRAGNEPRLRFFSSFFAGLGGVAAAGAVGLAATRINEDAFIIIVPVVAAVGVALALEVVAVRQAAGTPLRSPAIVAAWAAAAVSGILLLIPLLIAVALAAAGPSSLGRAWAIGPADLIVRTQDFHFFAVLALALVVGIAAAFWAVSGRLARRRTALAWAVAVLSVLAVPLLSVQWAVVAGWLMLGAASVVALILLAGRESGSRGPRTAILTVAIAATALGYFAGWASTGTWFAATIATILILVAARRAMKLPTAFGPSVLLGAATAVAFIGAGALARHIAYAGPHDDMVRVNDFSDPINIARFVGILGAVLLAVSALPLKAVTVLDRRVVFWMSAVTTSFAAVSGWLLLGIHEHPHMLLLPEYATSLVLSVATFGGILLWVVLRANAALRPERVAASMAVGPAVFWIVDSFVRVLGLPEFAESVAPATSALIVAAGALVFTILRPSTTPRWAWEVGIAIVAIPAVLQAVAVNGESLWLTLLLAGVTAIFLGISKDGLFGSASNRKHYGWLALALATAGLWVRLGDDNVTDLEPYVLSLAGALLLVALLVWRAAGRAPQPLPGSEAQPDATLQPSKAAPFIALGGLLVAILPLSANAITGTGPRAIVLVAVSGALLLLGSLVVGHAAIRPYLDVAALAGAIGVAVTATGRAIDLHPAGPGASDLRFDGWLGAAFLLLFIAAFGQARERRDAAARLRKTASQALGAIALTAALALEVTALGSVQFAQLRALAIILLFSAVHVVAFTVSRAPLSRAIGWLAITYAALAVVAGLSFDRLDPIEIGTVPVAVALLASGTLHLARTPAARSWPYLGPGTAVLLLPSLLATLFDEKALWRLVALGIVAVGAVVVGVVRRLQAPFLLGAIVAVIHGIATFSPQIRVVYQAAPWWLWAGIGGVLLILIAARYENRIKNLKDVVLKVGSLR